MYILIHQKKDLAIQLLVIYFQDFHILLILMRIKKIKNLLKKNINISFCILDGLNK